MDTYQKLLQRIAENEATAEKFFRVETKILSILDFQDFFDVLLKEIRATFGIPFVWLNIIETSDIMELIHRNATDARLTGSLHYIQPEKFNRLFGDTPAPLLSNALPQRWTPMIPSQVGDNVAAMVMIPLRLYDQPVGVLCLADTDVERFSPDYDDTLLKQLGVKVSLCLTNVTAHEKLRFMAAHDPLTGLVNRRALDNVIAREFERCRRYGHPLAVVFIDMDGFKQVNDTYGHACGDRLLKHFAGILQCITRGQDVAARYGGDEFVLILPETSSESAHILMTRIEAEAAAVPLAHDGRRIPVRFCWGSASMADSAQETYEKLLARADKALFDAKGHRNAAR